MRPTVIAGNWKMNGDAEGTRSLIGGILKELPPSLPPSLRLVIAPPFTLLSVAFGLLSGSRIELAGQTMSEYDDGAYTGEISWRMLQAAGCRYVILGHSERRQYFGESDALVNRKVKKALEKGLMPIMCIGETLDEREQGLTSSVIARQVSGGLDGLSADEVGRTIIAYEPVWAIGTGKTATPEQAQEVHAEIRRMIGRSFGPPAAESLVIQYGGSVKPENAGELLSLPDIDGALVGGASLRSDSFVAIVASATV